MLLREIFEVDEPSDKSVIKIPTPFITITPESKASLTDKQQNKIRIVSSKLRRGEITDTPPIQVKKIDRGFELVYGLVRLLAYQRAGIPVITAEVITVDSITENRQRYIIYINGKPSVYFDNKSDAVTQANVIRKRYPQADIKIELGIVTT